MCPYPEPRRVCLTPGGSAAYVKRMRRSAIQRIPDTHAAASASDASVKCETKSETSLSTPVCLPNSGMPASSRRRSGMASISFGPGGMRHYTI